MNSYFFVSKSNLQAVICDNFSCLVSNATTLINKLCYSHRIQLIALLGFLFSCNVLNNNGCV